MVQFIFFQMTDQTSLEEQNLKLELLKIHQNKNELLNVKMEVEKNIKSHDETISKIQKKLIVLSMNPYRVPLGLFFNTDISKQIQEYIGDRICPEHKTRFNEIIPCLFCIPPGIWVDPGGKLQYSGSVDWTMQGTLNYAVNQYDGNEYLTPEHPEDIDNLKILAQFVPFWIVSGRHIRSNQFPQSSINGLQIDIRRCDKGWTLFAIPTTRHNRQWTRLCRGLRPPDF